MYQWSMFLDLISFRDLAWCSSWRRKSKKLRRLEREIGAEWKEDVVVECKLQMVRMIVETELAIRYRWVRYLSVETKVILKRKQQVLITLPPQKFPIVAVVFLMFLDKNENLYVLFANWYCLRMIFRDQNQRKNS